MTGHCRRLVPSLQSDMISLMSVPTDALELNAIAAQVVSSLASHRQIPPFSHSLGEPSIADAYRLTALLRAAFEARGEKITGRKIGFTNRQMWAAHGVKAPIWGYCTDRTTFELDTTPVQHVSEFAEPRIEPEIMFGLGRAPSPQMDEADLLGCIDWIALGYEMVQSIFPGWKFAAFDTIAANALHGTLLVGKTPRDRAAQGGVAKRTGRLQRRTLLQRKAQSDRRRCVRARQPASSAAPPCRATCR